MAINYEDLKPVPPCEEGMNIVVTAAHHDDIEFGAAGSVAKWIQEGAVVTYIIITDGGAGSNDPATVREELITLRREEQMRAAAEVGVEDVRFLNYPDGVLEPTMALRRDLTRIIREVKPYRVVCQDPTTIFYGDSYINHPDHRAAGEATIYAVFPSSESRPIFPELLEEGYEPHKVSELYIDLTMNPTHYMDITSTMDRKIASLRQHTSQLGEGEALENGALKWIREGNAEGGKKVGVGYAEFYRVMKFDQDRNQDNADKSEAES